MSQQAESFVLLWAITNVHPSGFKPEGDLTEAKALAQACAAQAAPQGITPAELDAAGGGDLVEHMRRALNIAEQAREALQDG